MNSAFINLVTPKETINVSVNLENMPEIENNLTEETKKEIAYEILKRMKAKKLIRSFIYTEEARIGNVPDRTIDLV